MCKIVSGDLQERRRNFILNSDHYHSLLRIARSAENEARNLWVFEVRFLLTYQHEAEKSPWCRLYWSKPRAVAAASPLPCKEEGSILNRQSNFNSKIFSIISYFLLSAYQLHVYAAFTVTAGKRGLKRFIFPHCLVYNTS